MTTIVKGHGTDPDGENTFLPEGVRVRMYSAENVELASDIALLALLDGAGDPGDEITGTIRNYTLRRQDDLFVAQWYALAGESDVPIWWVGTDIPDGTRLCEDPNRGSDEADGNCVSLGVHTCSGILGLVTDSDIALVTCRGSAVGPRLPTAYDTTADGVARLVRGYLSRVLSGDPRQIASAEEDARHIPHQVLALMTCHREFDGWLKARWVKEYAELNDLQQMFGQLKSQGADLGSVIVWLDRIPSYGVAVDRVALEHPETFVAWLEHSSHAGVSNALKPRPAVAQALSYVAQAKRAVAG